MDNKTLHRFLILDSCREVFENYWEVTLSNTYNINITAPGLDEFVADEIVPRIQDAVRRGNSLLEDDIEYGIRVGKRYGVD